MEAGVKVTLLQRSDQVLPPLDWDMASEIHAHLREKGLDLRFKHAIESYEETEDGIIVHVKDREPIKCGFVVLAVGVVPESDLAKAAGLELGLKGSIKVDSHMRTSDPDIYAVGDAVEVVNPVTGKPEQKWLDNISVAEAAQYCAEGHFAPGSMLPKVQAAMRFAESKPGRRALITLLEKARDGIDGKTGTVIVNE